MALSVAELNKILRSAKHFERVLSKVNIISLGGGKCTAELKVEEEHSNILGGLHGGLSATLVDCISTYALFTHKYGGGVPTVSVHINTENLKANLRKKVCSINHIINKLRKSTNVMKFSSVLQRSKTKNPRTFIISLQLISS